MFAINACIVVQAFFNPFVVAVVNSFTLSRTFQRTLKLDDGHESDADDSDSDWEDTFQLDDGHVSFNRTAGLHLIGIPSSFHVGLLL